jgi:sulfur-carrier protein
LRTNEQISSLSTEAASVLVNFAPQLQRHVPCADQLVVAGTLKSALDKAFAAAPLMRSYVLDDQGFIRKHVAVFINGQLHRARHDLSVLVPNGTKIHVIQALSGG